MFILFANILFNDLQSMSQNESSTADEISDSEPNNVVKLFYLFFRTF